ncbi:ATP-binding cassette domain-containing protein [candidate division KSB1 bacterium]|nr:ATP-binding cassette domain-containing protein [candidate division KSB1 bacterium]
MHIMINIEHISFAYPSHGDTARNILRDVSVNIQPNESIAIMGHNGSGKTTFARCLNGLLIPTSGSVVVDGLNTAEQKNLAGVRRRVGMVFQNPDNQIVSTTVEREIAFGLENLGISYERMHAIVDEMLLKFNLGKYRLHPPHYLSGGEKQRLALAAVMAMRPLYLVLDEPTSLLDPTNRKEILTIVKSLHDLDAHAEPITTILITQFPEEALSVDRLLIFSQGQLIMDDNPRTIFQSAEALDSIGLEPPLIFKVQKMLDEQIKC